MPLLRVSDNLNTYGNAGNWETDPSTWGFTAPGFVTMSRSLAQKTKGNYSVLVKPVVDTFGILTWIDLVKFKAPAMELGKTYQIVAKVRTNTANPIASDNCELSFEGPIFPYLTTDTRRTVLSVKDTWLEVEGRFVCDALYSPTTEFYLRLYKSTGTAPIIDGELWIDELEVYEYIITGDAPEPDVIEKVYHSKNPITLQRSASVGWDALTNFRMVDDVRVLDDPGGSVYNSKLKIDLVPDADGNVVFQVREAFRGVLIATPPALNEDALQQLTDRIKKFKHYTGEVNGIAVTPGAYTQSAIYMVMLGGISKQQFPALGEGGFFDTYLPAQKKFLTWAPLLKEVDSNQEDYLTFFVYADTITSIKVRIKAYFDDGTNETDIIHTQEVSFAQLWQVPAGPANSGAKLINPAKTLIKYELSLLNQADVVISEIRTFTIDKINYPNRRFFLFLNSLGCYEVLRFYAVAEQEARIEKDVLVKYLPYNYAALDGEKEVNAATLQIRTSHGSGFLKTQSAKWLDYMKDFLMSSRVYDVTNGLRKPIVIEPAAYPMAADRNYERYIRFTALDSYQDDVYTPDEIE